MLLLLQEIYFAEAVEQYKDLDGISGVKAFEITNDAIEVQFLNGARYVYTRESSGGRKLARMKNLAKRGRGLNRYILKSNYYGYASKQR